MICPQCHKTFERLTPHQIYCSHKCQATREWKKRNARRKLRRRAEAEAKKVERVCAGCGATFRTVRDEQRYCSWECHKRNRNRERRAKRVCPVCKRIFTPETRGAVYCSHACYARRDKFVPTIKRPAPDVPDSSYPRIRAFIALPAAERRARRAELTPAELRLANKMWDNLHKGFAGYNTITC